MQAGDTVRVVAKNLKTFSGAAMLEADVSSALVEIWDETWTTPLLSSSPLVYTATPTPRWVYAWDSPGPAGFIAQVRIHIEGTDGSVFDREKAILLETTHGS